MNIKGEIVPYGGERSSRTYRERSNSIRRNGSNPMASPEALRGAYSARSHSLKARINPASLKPISHQELQALFAKYLPAGSVPEES